MYIPITEVLQKTKGPELSSQESALPRCCWWTPWQWSPTCEACVDRFVEEPWSDPWHGHQQWPPCLHAAQHSMQVTHTHCRGCCYRGSTARWCSVWGPMTPPSCTLSCIGYWSVDGTQPAHCYRGGNLCHFVSWAKPFLVNVMLEQGILVPGPCPVLGVSSTTGGGCQPCAPSGGGGQSQV